MAHLPCRDINSSVAHHIGSTVLDCIHSVSQQTGMQTPVLLYWEECVLKILFSLMHTLHLASH